jgi:methionyl-tRNA synthetase
MNTQTALSGPLFSFMIAHPFITLFVIIWSLVWKLIALWQAGKHNHLTIFIIIGVVNTVGLLEIIYLIWLYFKDKEEQKTA